jgi:hypothetical protein
MAGCAITLVSCTKSQILLTSCSGWSVGSSNGIGCSMLLPSLLFLFLSLSLAETLFDERLVLVLGARISLRESVESSSPLNKVVLRVMDIPTRSLLHCSYLNLINLSIAQRRCQIIPPRRFDPISQMKNNTTSLALLAQVKDIAFWLFLGPVNEDNKIPSLTAYLHLQLNSSGEILKAITSIEFSGPISSRKCTGGPLLILAVSSLTKI